MLDQSRPEEQAQTPRNETPLSGKLHQFIHMDVTFEPVLQFGNPLRCRMPSSIIWLKDPTLIVWAWRRRKDIFHKGWLNQWMTNNVVCRTAPGFVRVSSKLTSSGQKCKCTGGIKGIFHSTIRIRQELQCTESLDVCSVPCMRYFFLSPLCHVLPKYVHMLCFLSIHYCQQYWRRKKWLILFSMNLFHMNEMKNQNLKKKY